MITVASFEEPYIHLLPNKRLALWDCSLLLDFIWFGCSFSNGRICCFSLFCVTILHIYLYLYIYVFIILAFDTWLTASLIKLIDIVCSNERNVSPHCEPAWWSHNSPGCEAANPHRDDPEYWQSYRWTAQGTHSPPQRPHSGCETPEEEEEERETLSW